MTDLRLTIVETKALLDILGQDKVTPYDAGRLLEATGRAMQECSANFAMLPEPVQYECASVLNSAKRIVAEVKATTKELNEASTECFDATSKAVQQMHEAERRLKEAARQFAQRREPFSGHVVPYDLEKVLDLAERCNHFTPEQWERVVALASALGGK